MSSSPTETGTVDVTMPQMGVSVAEGTVIGWRVGVGDTIEAESAICDISTDKIDTEVPAPVTGVVTEILVPVESTVTVGSVLARIAPSDGASEPAPSGNGGAPAPAEPAAAPEAVSEPAPPRAAAGSNGHSRRYSPVVQRIAAEHGIDLSAVQGTGRGGRVRKQDVLALVEGGGTPEVAEPPLHIESPYRPEPVAPRPAAPAAPAAAAPAPAPAPVPAPAPAPAGMPLPSSGGELSRMRRQIGEHMKRSLDTAATCTTWIEVDFSGVEAARARLGVTALAFVARACVDAIREYPALNAWLEGENYTRHTDVNLGIAVSLGEDGLIVPVIQRAHELSVEGLAARVRDIARRARGRQLTPDDVQGGTFTITNPGQYGSIMATPIINQPQVAILDLEAVVKRPVVVTDAAGNDSIAIRPMCILGLSWDHRALDGALSAQFLAAVKRHLESVS
ncbi:MAG TPA: dihydrolipoamide acetyltransferase family protein [Solirubrobacteraceae bacterium]|nr:dihydrolipoamide acetyltransferase family protein [Solirubrobacteraceae bacterium]